MKLYAPKYYNSFKCIADKCTHSCCIGWEIDIDEKTLEKYTSFEDGYGLKIKQSIDLDEAPHFRLGADERCPHLNGKGLCSIITELGENYLCDICREHPRFYNDTVRGKEVGLGMACEEAARIILTSDEYNQFAEIGAVDKEAEDFDFDSVAERERIYTALLDRSNPYPERLESLFSEYNVSPRILDDDEWLNVIGSLEYLDEKHKTRFLNYSSDVTVPPMLEPMIERALAYFIFRHCSDSFDEAEFRARLGFCMFCERLLASVLMSENAFELREIIRYARIISEEIEYSEDNMEKLMVEFYIV